MDKGAILDYLFKKLKYTEEQKELVKAIEEARDELNNTRLYFESVKDPQLVDYAIYKEQAAKARFAFLLKQAKKSGIKIDASFMLDELEVI